MVSGTDDLGKGPKSSMIKTPPPRFEMLSTHTSCHESLFEWLSPCTSCSLLNCRASWLSVIALGNRV